MLIIVGNKEISFGFYGSPNIHTEEGVSNIKATKKSESYTYITIHKLIYLNFLISGCELFKELPLYEV